MPWYMEMKGADELNKNIQKLIKGVGPEKVEPILEDAAETIADAARANAPQGPTGNLKRGIVSKILKRRKETIPAPAMVGIDYRIAPHAHLVEFGHGGPHPAGPHPFFRPAWDENKDQLAQEIQERILDSIEKEI